MTRVKKGVNALKTRRNVLKQVKGYRFRRSKNERAAYEALYHAGKYSFAHRKDKKNDYRMLWNVKIGAYLKANGSSYSKFIGALKKKNIMVDRKIMADLIEFHPETMKKLVAKAI
ncbi:MAG: 50S ribosomal protein L20 [Candidatus Pacebacteria bacterium]|nr:50S ribosomal protein L20 [Candidatus Paceibacterota bacterium]